MRAGDAAPAATTIHGLVVPKLGRHGLQAQSITLMEPDVDMEDIQRDVADTTGLQIWQVPLVVVVVELDPADWARLFAPVRRAARQELSRAVDLSDSHVGGYRSTCQSGWIVCTEDDPGDHRKPARFQAMDSHQPGVIWTCSSVRCRSYEDLSSQYAPKERPEIRKVQR